MFFNKKKKEPKRNEVTFTQKEYDRLIASVSARERELIEENKLLQEKINKLEKQKAFLWRKCQLLIAEKNKNNI